MPASTTPFTILSYVGGPALLTNATALLLLSTSNRFGRAVDRSRFLVSYLEDLGGARTKSGAAQELIFTQKRLRLIGGALSGFYLATGMFAMATMISIFGAVLGEYIGGLAFEAVIVFAAVCGFVGFTALVTGSATLIWESSLATKSLNQEATETIDAIERALHSPPL